MIFKQIVQIIGLSTLLINSLLLVLLKDTILSGPSLSLEFRRLKSSLAPKSSAISSIYEKYLGKNAGQYLKLSFSIIKLGQAVRPYVFNG